MSRKIVISKKIPGFSDYAITNDGRVISNKCGRTKELKPSTSTGYAHVQLSTGEGKKNFQVHRLVADMFIANPKKLEIVNHKDGNKLNNDRSNLEWVSRTGNAKHYEETIAPKLRAQRAAKKDDDLKNRLTILKQSHSACTANPELFYSIFATVMA